MESIYPETGSYITPLLLLSPSIGQKDWKLCDHYHVSHHQVETTTVTITIAITIIIIMTMIIAISSIINMILAQKMINWVYAINSDPLFSSAGSSWWCICLSSQCLLYNPFVIFISIILITIIIIINSSSLQPFVISFVKTLMIIMMISSLKEGNL